MAPVTNWWVVTHLGLRESFLLFLYIARSALMFWQLVFIIYRGLRQSSAKIYHRMILSSHQSSECSGFDSRLRFRNRFSEVRHWQTSTYYPLFYIIYVFYFLNQDSLFEQLTYFRLEFSYFDREQSKYCLCGMYCQCFFVW